MSQAVKKLPLFGMFWFADDRKDGKVNTSRANIVQEQGTTANRGAGRQDIHNVDNKTHFSKTLLWRTYHLSFNKL